MPCTEQTGATFCTFILNISEEHGYYAVLIFKTVQRIKNENEKPVCSSIKQRIC